MAGVLRVMAAFDVIDGAARSNGTTIEVTHSTWGRASQSGVVHLDVSLGQYVREKQRLARITEPFGNAAADVHAPLSRAIIGHTSQPLVYRGYAVIHLAAVQQHRNGPHRHAGAGPAPHANSCDPHHVR